MLMVSVHNPSSIMAIAEKLHALVIAWTISLRSCVQHSSSETTWRKPYETGFVVSSIGGGILFS